MASIKISELRPAGVELFQDSESFLNEIGEQEMGITGGRQFTVAISVSAIINTNVGNTVNANTLLNFNTVAVA